MKYLMLVCLPIAAALMAWQLLAAPATPGTSTPLDRQVPSLVVADSSGHGRHGIAQGEVVMGLPGHDGGRAFSFNGKDSWVQVSSEAGLNPRRRDFLLTAWVMLTTEPGPGETYDVVRKGLGYTYPGEFKMEVLSHGWVRCSAKDQWGRLAVVTNKQVDVTDGEWHRIGCARVGEVWGALADETMTSRPVTLAAVKNTVVLSIGSKYGFEDRPEGRIDDVRIAARPQPPEGTEQLDFATGVRELEWKKPAGLWRLDESATSAVGR